MIFSKTLHFTEKVTLADVQREQELQRVCYKYNVCPKVYDLLVGREKAILEMEDLKAPNLYEVFGEDPLDVPGQVWEQIWTILNTLFVEEGIEYVDITPYNFLIRHGKVWIIDFGHAYYCKKGAKEPANWFLREFLIGKGGIQKWNPDFR